MSDTVRESAKGPAGPSDRAGVVPFLRRLLAVRAGKVAWVLVSMLLRSAAAGIGLLLLVPMLGVVGLDVGGGSIGSVARAIERGFAWIGLEPTLVTVLAAYVAITVLTAALIRWQAVLSRSLEQDVVADLRKQLYGSVVRARWSYIVGERGSDHTHVLTTEVERAGAAVSAFLSLVVQVVLALVYVTVAVVLSPLMTAVVALAGAALAAVLRGPTLRGQEKGAAITRSYRELYGAISDHMAGLKVAKSLGIQDSQEAYFGRVADRAADARMDLERNTAGLAFGFQVGSVVILAAIVWFALEALALPVATLLILLFLFARLIPIGTGVQKGYQRLLNVLPAYHHARAVLARSEAAAESPVRSGPPFALRESVELAGVSYGYGTGEPVLRGVDLTLRAGETTAMVGPSGAGKSTLADVVIGLAMPDRGTVRIDGEPLAAERVHAWRRQVGYVPQDVFLFHDTIRANLAMVAEGADDADLWRALDAASAADFVATLPDGLDTVVGDRGVRLSGGERQRIALARALLRRPALLVLDEATSSLDAENERRIQAAIERLHGTVTILVIAHRLSTVRRCDAIFVLEGGRVVESGDWDALMARTGGRLRELSLAHGTLDGDRRTDRVP